MALSPVDRTVLVLRGLGLGDALTADPALERHLDRLDARQVALFRELLELPDNDLLDLVMGTAEPADPRLRPVLELLRGNCAVATGA